MKDLVTVEEIVSMLEGYWRFCQREGHRRSAAGAIATLVAERWAEREAKMQELISAAEGYVEFDLAEGTTADFCAAGDRLRIALRVLKE